MAKTATLEKPAVALRGRPRKPTLLPSAANAKADQHTRQIARQQINVPRIDIRLLHIRLVGDSGLLCHNWSEKQKRAMLDKQMKVAQPGQEAKDPQADYRASMYPMPHGGGWGFPTVAFKSAAVDGCRFVAGIKMTEARGAFHINTDLTRINGEPRMVEHMVRVGMGQADIRYRALFENWSVDLAIRYNAAALSAAQIVGLFNAGGFGVGVGEWRPEKNGSNGMFHCANEADEA